MPPARSPRSRAFDSALSPRLVPVAARQVALRLAELKAAAREAGADKALAAVIRRKAVADFVASVMECSPYLRALILDDPARLAALLTSDPAVRARAIAAQTERAWRKADEPALMAALRRARAEMALLTALADLGGVWNVDTVTAALTRFADAAVGASVRFVLRSAAEAGQIALPEMTRPEEGSGWIVLGLGKFGAGELNYSSDIDLIVLFDREVARVAEGRETQTFVRLTQRLVALLNERTAEGYVFRTDLRLRPDPGATNIAISTEAALQYYESLGQNWERAALIKARPVAGDKAAGAAFLAALTPYIWRKYLDYAAIADIHSIKRQIHDHRGHADVAIAGHNIKLGRGGIREIEFFVQTQQLIAGGRRGELRGRSTLDMLAALAAGGWIDAATRDDLAAAYRELRTVEHCLQMVADEQTHTLPEDDSGLSTIARMAGYRDRRSLAASLGRTLTTVRDRYAALFEAAPSLSTGTGNLSFTGHTDDPGTLAALARLGFGKPQDVTAGIRAWHFGRYPAMRSATARERLTEFTPALIAALAATDSADAAFASFDRFLARLPAGVQLFSLLQTNPRLLDLIVTILASAPRLAETIVHRAHVLDALLDPSFFGRLPERGILEARLAATFAEARSFEDVLNRARIFGEEQRFLIGVRLLAGSIAVKAAAYAYADLADMLIAAMLVAVRREFATVHGRIRRGEVALVAMGKLGGREMTATSDLDLILLYDFDGTADTSDGERPLPGPLYFARLTQRLVAAIASPTAEGTLYPVDFRLRPSGRSGPLATHIEAFAAYQAKDAWTWERMALTRARVIAGDARLVKRATAEIARILRTPRDREKTISDVLAMRAMVEEAKGGEGIWDIKQAPGGLVDIEFVAQSLLLLNAARRPSLLSTETGTVLARAAEAGLLPASEADILVPALRLYQGLIQVIRLCLGEPFDPAAAPRGALDRLAAVAELPDFSTLAAHLAATEAEVRKSFERLVGKVPAKRAAV